MHIMAIETAQQETEVHFILLGVIVIMLFARAPLASIVISLVLAAFAFAMLIAMQAGDVDPSGYSSNPSQVTATSTLSVIVIGALAVLVVVLVTATAPRSGRRRMR